jgi:hypothetical protein
MSVNFWSLSSLSSLKPVPPTPETIKKLEAGRENPIYITIVPVPQKPLPATK